jgi:hypothetical protein
MNGSPSHANSDSAAEAKPDSESITGIPRWVKVLGVIAAIAVVLYVISMAMVG